MLPRGIGQVGRRIVVDQIDVGDQAGASEEPLEQIVAEQRVRRNPVRKRSVERVDVVDSLADVAPLVKEVLIDVRDRGRVGIDADVAREDLREGRPVRADDADADAGLEHAVALGDALQRLVEARTIQRMR
jgi:hypothetical protein